MTIKEIAQLKLRLPALQHVNIVTYFEKVTPLCSVHKVVLGTILLADRPVGPLLLFLAPLGQRELEYC